jgi:hypothetical protein
MTEEFLLTEEEVVVEPVKKEAKLSKGVVKMANDAITISQFVRMENLGYFKRGFVVYVNTNKIGGRRTRADWYKTYEDYMKRPKTPFRKF